MMDELLQRGEALAMFTQGNAGQRQSWRVLSLESAYYTLFFQ